MAVTRPMQATAQLPWYREISPAQWRVLTASFLGWIFDGYETYSLFVVMAPALRQLLPADQLQNLTSYAGTVSAATLLGWAVGGLSAGILADYIGRKRMMMVTILVYAIFTGLTGLAQNWVQLGVFRFLTGLGLGGEWATGATLIAESWPARARAKGQGIMQSAFGWGALLAAGVWYILQQVMGVSAWRVVFFIGVLPAFVILYIRRSVHESEQWSRKNQERRTLRAQRRSGTALSTEQAVVVQFTVAALFRNPTLRRRVLLCLVMSLASTLGLWGISSWIPAYAESAARAASVPNPTRWGAIAGICYNAGGIVGYLTAGFLADIIGRRYLLVGLFSGSLLVTPLLYLWVHSPMAIVLAAALNGAFTLGQFSWLAIYPPELFPTAVRATAASMVFDTARFISFLGPLIAGLLITRLGGYSTTALLFSAVYVFALCAVPFLPETKGQPLPQ